MTKQQTGREYLQQPTALSRPALQPPRIEALLLQCPTLALEGGHELQEDLPEQEDLQAPEDQQELEDQQGVLSQRNAINDQPSRQNSLELEEDADAADSVANSPPSQRWQIFLGPNQAAGKKRISDIDQIKLRRRQWILGSAFSNASLCRTARSAFVFQ